MIKLYFLFLSYYPKNISSSKFLESVSNCQTLILLHILNCQGNVFDYVDAWTQPLNTWLFVSAVQDKNLVSINEL